MNLLEVINECVGKDDNVSEVGLKLFRAAKKHRQKAEEKGAIEETEIELKIRSLRGAEKEGNLAWMNNSSWYRLPLVVRQAFLNEVDPLVWSGIYFKNSDFNEKAEQILSKAEEICTIAVIRDAKNYKFVSISLSSAREFDSMSENEFNRYCKDFSSKLVRIIGTSAKRGISYLEVAKGV